MLGLGLGANKLRGVIAFTIDSITSLVLWLQGDDTAYLNSKLAAQFTSANSEFLSTTSTDFDKGNEDFSVGGWFYCDGTGANDFCIGKYTSASKSYLLYATAANVWSFAISNDGTAFQQIGTTARASGQWYFIAGVYDSVNDLLKISVDGAAFESVANTTGAFATATADFASGSAGDSNNANYLTGRADNNFFYDKALTLAQVGALYNTGSGVDYSDFTSDMLVSLVSLWRMDEASGTRADAHGTNTLTDNNTVTSALGKVVDTPVIDVSQIWRIVDRSTNGDIYDQDTATAQPAWASLTPNSLDYDGTTDYLDITGALTSYLAATTKGFICAWIRLTDATPASNNVIISFGDTVGSNEYLTFEVVNTTGTLRCQLVQAGVSKFSVATDAAITTDATWVHAGVIQNAVSPVLFINGLAVAQTPAGTNQEYWISDLPNVDNGRVSCYNKNSGGNTLFLDGAIDQVLLGNDEITAATMLDIYNNGLAAHP